MKNRNHGFTLLEVIIVIAIVAILASLAIPSNKDLLENNRAESFLTDLKRSFAFARAKASSADEIVVVCAAPEASITTPATFSCQSDWNANQIVVFVDYNGNYSFDNGTDIMLRTLDKLPNLDKIKSTVTKFRFDTSGRLADGQAATIIYCPNSDNENNKQLTISQGGTALYNGETTTACQ